MAIYLGVQKYFENNIEIIYEVESNDFGGVHYFLYIKKLERRIYFFKDKDLKLFLGTFDLDDFDKPFSIVGIEPRVVWHSIKKLIKCIENNAYDENLDFCA